MDKTTHDIRLVNWKAIIERCQSQSQDQIEKQWIVATNVLDKQYYYWFRKKRFMVFQEMNVSLPIVFNNKDTVPVSFSEFSDHDLLELGFNSNRHHKDQQINERDIFRYFREADGQTRKGGYTCSFQAHGISRFVVPCGAADLRKTRCYSTQIKNLM